MSARSVPILLPRCQVEGEVKYVRLAGVRLSTGEFRFINPLSCASHANAVLPGECVYSAGRVVVDRETRTVVMGDRDSYSLGVKSAPGDEDAEAVRECLFAHWPASRSAVVRS